MSRLFYNFFQKTANLKKSKFYTCKSCLFVLKHIENKLKGMYFLVYSIFRNLAIIILSAKFCGLVSRKCKAPQVVGEILAGLLIGPCLLNLVQISDTISVFAEIGVVLLMFSTGLGTNLKELLRAGPIATLVACVGVFVPLVGGTLLYGAFFGLG